MARISVIRHGDSYHIKLSGRFAAADLGRLERACGVALQRKPAPLQLNLEAVTKNLERIRCGYVEMPGLVLTVRQAARLVGINARQADRLLSELTDSGFLVRDQKKGYRRR